MLTFLYTLRPCLRGTLPSNYAFDLVTMWLTSSAPYNVHAEGPEGARRAPPEVPFSVLLGLVVLHHLFDLLHTPALAAEMQDRVTVGTDRT